MGVPLYPPSASPSYGWSLAPHDVRTDSRTATAGSPPITTARRTRTLSDTGREPVNSPLYGLAPEVAAMIRQDPSSSSSSNPASPPPYPALATTSSPSMASPAQSNPAALQALDARLDQVLGSITRTSSAVGNNRPSSPDPDDPHRMLAQVRMRLDETRRRIADTANAVRGSGMGDEVTNSPADARQSTLSRDIRFANRVDILATTLNSIAERTLSLSGAIDSLRMSAPERLPRSPSPRSATATHASTAPALSPTSPTASSTPSMGTTSPPASPSGAVEEHAAQTDEIRAVVRQLILMSRRVSAVIAQHRDQVGTTPAGLPSSGSGGSGSGSGRSTQARAGSPPAAQGEEGELPGIREPLPVLLPSYLEERAPPPDTTPNLDGLLLPRSDTTPAQSAAPRVFSTSPQAMSPPSDSLVRGSRSTTLAGPSSFGAGGPDQDDDDEEEEESYPGERAQLYRIAQLQTDIAARAGELRALRARGRELSRERREREERRLSRDGGRDVPTTVGGASQGAAEAVAEGATEAEKEEEEVGWGTTTTTVPGGAPSSGFMGVRADGPLVRRRQSEMHGWRARTPRMHTQAHHHHHQESQLQPAAVAAVPIPPIQVAVDAIRRDAEYQTWRMCGR